jgi:hypothetical protein
MASENVTRASNSANRLWSSSICPGLHRSGDTSCATSCYYTVSVVSASRLYSLKCDTRQTTSDISFALDLTDMGSCTMPQLETGRPFLIPVVCKTGRLRSGVSRVSSLTLSSVSCVCNWNGVIRKLFHKFELVHAVLRLILLCENPHAYHTSNHRVLTRKRQTCAS